ncbi:AAA family ATPase [Rhodoferax sp. BLA1]|uniref:AAA family ATPase n=1 Tax=Rhodoferax sp. BLA1 TaxID=2576062 RepID=UPI0015D348DE|nr:ATP-binding protein [Rhodoferax sp. BLA1]
MLNHLKLKNVGPAPSMELTFGQRLNLITGDNGLGKSFLLDIAWWALTRKWPSEINPRLTSGKRALPSSEKLATIGFAFAGKSRVEDYESSYLPRDEAWTGRPGRPANPGLVFYAMADGSFAVWDPVRNYWRTQDGVDVQDRIPAYVFSPAEVWDGLLGKDGKPLCLGLVMDWAGWQKENSSAFESLQAVLKAMSPSDKERLTVGELTRVSLDDARDIPTIRMPYGQDVAVLHASAGMRRILALAYLLVWTWEEHCKAAKLLREEPTNQVVFLIDEVESHLHPQWQRQIIPALLAVARTLIKKAEIQVITATHSPLVMASVEPLFDAKRDAWFDLDLERRKVVLRQREFEKHGSAASWLVSEAFDLQSGRALEYEDLVKRAAALLEQDAPSADRINAMNAKLVEALNPTDDFLFNWRYVCKKKGWLE